MGWTAKIHMGGVHQLLVRCSSCASPCYDVCELPTGDRICIKCVAQELAKAEDEIDVDKKRRLVNVVKN